MKIAYMLGSLNRGGTETLLLDVFSHKELLPECVCIYRKTGVLENDFIRTGVKMKKITVGSSWFSYLRKLRAFMKQEKIDLVHAQQPIDACIALLATIGLPVKIVQTLHGYDYNNGFFAKIVLLISLKLTQVNVYVSHHVRKYYTQKYNLNSQKQVVVYNGINLNKIQLNTQTISNSFRSELGIEENTVLMGMVGNFVPVRDQMTICRLIHKLKEQYINFHFVFVGKKTDAYPELYDSCYQYCQKNNLLHQVSFLGSRNDVPLLLPQLDAFVYATDHDTFGIAVVEAMLAGVPVFVNDWEVMREISDDGKYMTLYKTKDEDDLLNQMMLFINNKSEHRKKAMLAQEYAMANFSIEKHINCLCSLYTDIINTKK